MSKRISDGVEFERLDDSDYQVHGLLLVTIG
jgi:hypothetical protein